MLKLDFGNILLSGLIVIFFVGQAHLASAQSPDARKIPAQKTASLYQHPVRGFEIAIPPNVEIIEDKGGDRLSVRSRKGFVINIQSGDRKAEYTEEVMFGILEQQYLGAGKPWNRKLDQNTVEIGGIVSRQVVYNGPNTRSRVIITRGVKTDFVFMFFAPQQY